MILQDSLRRARSLVFTQDLNAVRLDDETWHHLANTLRIATDDPIAVSDGRGLYQIFTARRHLKPALVKSARKKWSEVDFFDYFTPVTDICTSESAERETGVGISLCKPDKMEWAVQKLTEVGVGHIWPILAERSQVRRFNPEDARVKKILLEAASQARRTKLPILHELLSPQEAYREMAALGKVAMAEPGGHTFSSDLTCVMIGPEGGWSPEELSIADPVQLSSGILRVETAATVAGYLLSVTGSHNLRKFPEP